MYTLTHRHTHTRTHTPECGDPIALLLSLLPPPTSTVWYRTAVEGTILTVSLFISPQCCPVQWDMLDLYSDTLDGLVLVRCTKV